MPGTTPTSALSPAPRSGWTAIIGRGTGRDAVIAVLYPPAPPSPAVTPPEGA